MFTRSPPQQKTNIKKNNLHYTHSTSHFISWSSLESQDWEEWEATEVIVHLHV